MDQSAIVKILNAIQQLIGNVLPLDGLHRAESKRLREVTLYKLKYRIYVFIMMMTTTQDSSFIVGTGMRLLSDVAQGAGVLEWTLFPSVFSFMRPGGASLSVYSDWVCPKATTVGVIKVSVSGGSPICRDYVEQLNNTGMLELKQIVEFSIGAFSICEILKCIAYLFDGK